MSLITITYIFSVGNTIIASQHNANFSVIYNDYNGNITDANIASNAGVEYTKLALNNTIKSTDILSTTVFSKSNIPTLNYYIKVSEIENSGTSGSGLILNTWTNVVLNTKDYDTGSLATLSSNQVSLPSGTYLVRASVPSTGGQPFQVRVYNVTGSAVLVLGQNGPAISNNVSLVSGASGLFTISITSNIAIQYYSGTGTGTIGAANSFGTEVYSIAEFTKVA